MGCQADVMAKPLASFALIMTAEAVEPSAATNFRLVCLLPETYE